MKKFLFNLYTKVVFILMLYVGGWLMIVKPMLDLITFETLTGTMLARITFKMVFAIPVIETISILGTAIGAEIFRGEIYK